MKPHVSKNRLETLAKFLDELPPKRFKYTLFGNGELKKDPKCKAVGCALGWASTMPQFKRLGLYSRISLNDMWIHFDSPEKGDLVDFEAAQELFGLSLAETGVLFNPNDSAMVGNKLLSSPGAKATPKTVAAHIRKFIKLKWPEKKK